MSELSEVFNSRINDFQRDLMAATPGKSPSSSINPQFFAFRSFVLSSLESLQRQIDLLSKHQDELEMRSRRKVLLIHGVAEEKKEKTVAKVPTVFSEKLKLADFTSGAISRCHRLGSLTSSKTRPILAKFYESQIRDKCWSLKNNLKGSGITISEFLTKQRHDAFILARRNFGVTNCWTRDGHIIVLSSDGVRHRVTTVSEVTTIHGASNNDSDSVSASATTTSKNTKSISNARSKRIVKK